MGPMNKSLVIVFIACLLPVCVACWLYADPSEQPYAPRDSTVEDAHRGPVAEDDYPLSFAYTGMRFGPMATLPSKTMNEAFARLCLNGRAEPGALVKPMLDRLENHLRTVGPRCAERSFEI